MTSCGGVSCGCFWPKHTSQGIHLGQMWQSTQPVTSSLLRCRSAVSALKVGADWLQVLHDAVIVVCGCVGARVQAAAVLLHLGVANQLQTFELIAHDSSQRVVEVLHFDQVLCQPM